MSSENPTLGWARKHVKAVRDFLYHLMVFVLVNAMLVIVDVLGGGPGDILGLDWAYWVIIAWGFGLAGHAISVFYGEARVQRLAARHRASE